MANTVVFTNTTQIPVRWGMSPSGRSPTLASGVLQPSGTARPSVDASGPFQLWWSPSSSSTAFVTPKFSGDAEVTLSVEVLRPDPD